MAEKITSNMSTGDGMQDTEVKNLAFLQEFLGVNGISVPQAADLMGYTRHAILKWFRNDDAPLSKVETLVEKCGYKLVISLDRPEQSSPVRVSIEGETTGSANRRLAFLERALITTGLSKSAASKMIGMCESSFGYWLRVDDCDISHLVDFARKTGLVLNISFKKL